ncbi:PBSX family phage terminase large subunit [Streptomyces sp. NBC_01565]|uniref:PBSX family phage terminase large subunit n=1 Tax=Streptomyces sp. NBC_01565 TaxID=2975881 RepID=UPI002254D6D6|nr:PBSX family phage terminase large subunit [Streptomyces sp. NBC_01565]MCX4540488.1 PBSX family phage terminase large subunit [Streptomyces sp. NBC_01565]
MLRDVPLPLSPAQIRSIVESQDTPIALWSGAVSSGKTIGSLIAFLMRLAVAPDHGLIVIVGRTLQTIERNIIDPLQSNHLFGPLAKHVIHTNGSTTATILGRTVHLVGASDARAEGRIRGSTIALAYVDEATLVPHPFWMMLLSRLRVGAESRLLATTNPDGPFHWLRKDFILRGAEVGLRNWHFTLDDNPSLDPGFVERLKAQYVGLWFRRFILGEWCLASGAVYDMFDEHRHVVDSLPYMRRWTAVGIDYGTVNPFSAVLIGQGEDDRLYAVSEYRHDSALAHRQLTDAQYSLNVRQWLANVRRPGEQGSDRGVRPEWIFVDPSAASFMNQLWTERVPGISPAINDVLDGIRSVGVALGSGLLRIHRSCEGLLGELPGYAWDERAAERGEDKPLKIEDHSADALRYALHSTAHEWRHLIDYKEATGAAA